jgi:hypothetical protein
MHQSVSIGTDVKKIPETVAFYNSTKFGVDVVDQMARKYTVKAGSRRWPVQVFYNILDLAGINAWILYKEVTGKSMRRRDFLLQLATELRKPYVAARESTAHVHPRNVSANQTNPNKRRQCQVGKCKNNKTRDSCFHCKKMVCGSCTSCVESRNVCVNCDADDVEDDQEERRTMGVGRGLGRVRVRRTGQMMTLPMR